MQLHVSMFQAMSQLPSTTTINYHHSTHELSFALSTGSPHMKSFGPSGSGSSSGMMVGWPRRQGISMADLKILRIAAFLWTHGFEHVMNTCYNGTILVTIVLFHNTNHISSSVVWTITCLSKSIAPAPPLWIWQVGLLDVVLDSDLRMCQGFSTNKDVENQGITKDEKIRNKECGKWGKMKKHEKWL